MSGLEARIHHGAEEIGGNCLELRCDGQTVLIDLGAPLDGSMVTAESLPSAIGVVEPGPRPLGVFVSHGHRDHWGLVPFLKTSVPVWIGEGAGDILRAAEFWGVGVDLCETGHLRDRVPIRVGPFTITPYLADHSGFDAYSLLVEAGGKRLFYTGDFRGHGRKAAAFRRLIEDPPTRADVLVMEGTSLRSPGDGDGSGPSTDPTESDLEMELAQTLRTVEGTVVVLGSPQNIDRLVTTYRAALRSDRDLVLDVYATDVAAATSRESIPHLGDEWPRVWAYLPRTQRARIVRERAYARATAVRSRRVFPESLHADPRRWVLFGAFSGEVSRLLADDTLTGGAVVWSMWEEYLASESGARLREQLDRAGVPLLHHHVSGHASVETLKAMADAIAPKWVVPIHTDAPTLYATALDRPVRMEPNGKWWRV